MEKIDYKFNLDDICYIIHNVFSTMYEQLINCEENISINGDVAIIKYNFFKEGLKKSFIELKLEKKLTNEMYNEYKNSKSIDCEMLISELKVCSIDEINNLLSTHIYNQMWFGKLINICIELFEKNIKILTLEECNRMISLLVTWNEDYRDFETDGYYNMCDEYKTLTHIYKS